MANETKPAPAINAAATGQSRITIRTVAEDAGVSVSAVSKVLRDAYGVSDELEARVRASIKRLGYRPSASARGMRGRSYTLGVLLSDIENPFFSQIMAGIDSCLEATPFQSMLGVSYATIGIEQNLVDAMIDRQMDGLIFVAPRMSAEQIERAAARLPSVVIGHHRPGGSVFDTVNGDDEGGAELAIDHLVAQGHRRIAHITLALPPDQDNSVVKHREIGYRRAMDKHGLSRFATICHADHSPKAREVARALLTGPDRPDAVLCWTDACAFETVSAALELGMAIPRDVTIVGYDNSPPCRLAQNDLSSVDQMGQSLGARAATMLIDRIKGRNKVQHVVLTPELIVRGSSRPPQHPLR